MPRDPASWHWPDPCHLALEPGVNIDPLPLARELSPLVKIPIMDLAPHLRYGGGWLLRGLEGGIAQQVYERIHERTPLIPIADDVPLERPPIRRVRGAKVDEDAIQLSFAHGEWEQHRAEEFACLIALAQGAIRAAASEKKAAGPVERRAQPSSDFNLDERTELARKQFHRVDLHLDGAAVYLVLAEPVEFIAIEQSVLFTDRWITILADLVDVFPPRRVLPQARAILVAEDLESVLISKREEYDARLIWLAELVGRDLWEGFR